MCPPAQHLVPIASGRSHFTWCQIARSSVLRAGVGRSAVVHLQELLEAERAQAKAELEEEKRRGKERSEGLLKQLEDKWNEIATLRRGGAP